MNARTRSERVFEYRRTRLFNRDTSCLDTNKQAPTNPSGHRHDDYPHHALGPKTSHAASLGSSVMRPRLPVTSLFCRPSRSERILSRTRLSHSHCAIRLSSSMRARRGLRAGRPSASTFSGFRSVTLVCVGIWNLCTPHPPRAPRFLVLRCLLTAQRRDGKKPIRVYQPGFAKNERRASFRVNLACSSG